MVVLRTGDSRGFAFVRYKYADEAQKAIERLDGVHRAFSLLFLFVGDFVLLLIILAEL